jgi:hypothetical protein
MIIGNTNQGIKCLVKNIIHGFYDMVPQILKTSEKHTKIIRAGLRVQDSICYDFYYLDLPDKVDTNQNEN